MVLRGRLCLRTNGHGAWPIQEVTAELTNRNISNAGHGGAQRKTLPQANGDGAWPIQEVTAELTHKEWPKGLPTERKCKRPAFTEGVASRSAWLE